jgi:hypothetical protein
LTFEIKFLNTLKKARKGYDTSKYEMQ